MQGYASPIPPPPPVDFGGMEQGSICFQAPLRHLEGFGERRIFEGWASVRGFDFQDMEIPPEAFQASLSHYLLKNPVILWDHFRALPIGRVLNAKVESSGLYIRGEVFRKDDLDANAVALDVPDAIESSLKPELQSIEKKANEVWGMVLKGWIRGLSVSGFPRKTEEITLQDGTILQRVLDFLLTEISITPIQVNSGSQIVAANAIAKAMPMAKEQTLSDVLLEMGDLEALKKDATLPSSLKKFAPTAAQLADMEEEEEDSEEEEDDAALIEKALKLTPSRQIYLPMAELPSKLFLDDDCGECIAIVEKAGGTGGHKYIRRYKGPSGKWVYVYADTKGKGGKEYKLSEKKLLGRKGKIEVDAMYSAGPELGYVKVNAVEGDRVTYTFEGEARTEHVDEFRQRVLDAHHDALREIARKGEYSRNVALLNAARKGEPTEIAAAYKEWKNFQRRYKEQGAPQKTLADAYKQEDVEYIKAALDEVKSGKKAAKGEGKPNPASGRSESPEPTSASEGSEDASEAEASFESEGEQPEPPKNGGDQKGANRKSRDLMDEANRRKPDKEAVREAYDSLKAYLDANKDSDGLKHKDLDHYIPETTHAKIREILGEKVEKALLLGDDAMPRDPKSLLAELTRQLSAEAQKNGGEIPADVALELHTLTQKVVLPVSLVSKSLPTDPKQREIDALQARIAQLEGKPAPLRNQVPHAAGSQPKPVSAPSGKSLLEKSLDTVIERNANGEFVRKADPLTVAKLLLLDGERKGTLVCGEISNSQEMDAYLAGVISQENTAPARSKSLADVLQTYPL